MIRYILNEFGDLTTSPSGDYCEYKDVLQLEARVKELEGQNKRLRNLFGSAVHHLDYESFPMWREDSPNWEAWYKKVERLKEHLATSIVATTGEG